METFTFRVSHFPRNERHSLLTLQWPAVEKRHQNYLPSPYSSPFSFNKASRRSRL